jgi:RNA polymerase sigma factor (sigma-70 family)
MHELNDQFEAIVNDHYQGLYRFALSLTRSQTDAKDLVQQTFYTWATKGHQLRDTTKVKTWLFTTLHRLFLYDRRKTNKVVCADLDEVAEQVADLSATLPEDMDSSRVLLALSRVDAVYQAAVALFYLQDWRYKEIALVLKIPIGTVKSRIARGVAQLREIVLSEEFDEVVPNSAGVGKSPPGTSKNEVCGPALFADRE